MKISRDTNNSSTYQFELSFKSYTTPKMKFSTIACGLLAAASRVLAVEGGFFDSAKDQVGLSKFQLDYVVEQYPELSVQDVAEMFCEEDISLLYTITNEEDSDLTVVGLGGSFRDPLTGESLVNLTANSVGPVVIAPGETATVGQKILLELIPANYYLSPLVYVAFKDELKQVQARPQLITLKEMPVSFFNPQWMFLELLFFGTIGILGYFAYTSWFKSYFVSITPVDKNVPVSAKTSGFDPAWVPSHHQVTQKKRSKARKAY